VEEEWASEFNAEPLQHDKAIKESKV
jgi:hypothetical protein